MATDDQLLIHHIIDSVQRSIDIADKTSRKKYNFALARMEVKVSFSFDIKEDKSKTQTKSSQPQHWLTIHSQKHDPNLSNTEGSDEDSRGRMTLQMLFKPGGKAFISDADQPEESSSDSGSFSDNDDLGDSNFDSDSDSDFDSDSSGDSDSSDSSSDDSNF